MKHLKLFESFDRYEFGEFTDPAEILGKVHDIFQSSKDMEFTPEEKTEIRKIIPNFTTFMGKIDFTRADNVNRIRESFRIYPLGDYCYALDKTINEFNKDILKYDKLWIIDDFDNLLVKLQELVDDNGLESFLESISRYDFGVLYDSMEIKQFIDDNYDSIINFTPDEALEMREVVGSKFDMDAFNSYWSIYNEQYPLNTICLYSFGDYCYGITFGEFSSVGYVYKKLYVIDEFENLLSKLQELVDGSENIKVYEGISRYDFGKYTDYDTIDKLWNSFYLNASFTDKDHSEISNILAKYESVFDTFYGMNAIYFKTIKLEYIIIPLGDYCYAIFTKKESDSGYSVQWYYCEIIDGIDDLCDLIKKTIDSSKPINESFDRYDFGVHLATDNDLYGMYHARNSSISSLNTIYGADTISKAEYKLIKKAVSGKLNATYSDSLKGRKYVTLQNRKMSNMQFFIHYLGDHCYCIVKLDKSVYKFISIEMVDQFDSLLDILKNMSIT